MMNKQIAGLVLAISVVGGIGTGVLANALTSEDPATTSTPKLTIAPGAVGPVKVGMSRADALATGYFEADVKASDEGCPDLPLAWKAGYADTFDVQTLRNGEIASIGIRGDDVVTAGGVGVGSTYAQVSGEYPDETVVEAGYGQSGLRFFDGAGGWVGFLFDPAPDAIEDTDRVTFVEVTRGAEPSLMRDGC